MSVDTSRVCGEVKLRGIEFRGRGKGPLMTSIEGFTVERDLPRVGDKSELPTAKTWNFSLYQRPLLLKQTSKNLKKFTVNK